MRCRVSISTSNKSIYNINYYQTALYSLRLFNLFLFFFFVRKTLYFNTVLINSTTCSHIFIYYDECGTQRERIVRALNRMMSF